METLELKKVHKGSIKKTKSFLDDVYALTHKGFVDKNVLFVPKDGERIHLSKAHKISNAYNYLFLVNIGFLLLDDNKIKWALDSEPTYDMVYQMKTVENQNKKNKKKEEVENPIEELVNRIDENAVESEKDETKKSFFELIVNGFEESKKRDEIIIRNQNRLIELEEKRIQEQSKIILGGLTEFMENNG